MKEKHINNFKLFTFEKIKKDKNISAYITTKFYNNKPVFKIKKENIEKNFLFKKLLDDLNVKSFFYMDQKHTSNVYFLKEERLKTFSNIDGVFTDLKNKALIGFSADCSLSFFYDKKNKIIGICHAGWRGALLNIYENMYKNMALNFSTKPRDLFVGIGPFISEKEYIVGNNLIEKFKIIYPKNYKNFYIKKKNKIFFSIEKVLKFQLKKLNIKNYEFSKECTYTNENFYSHRKKDKERFLLITWLK